MNEHLRSLGDIAFDQEHVKDYIAVRVFRTDMGEVGELAVADRNSEVVHAKIRESINNGDGNLYRFYAPLSASDDGGMTRRSWTIDKTGSEVK